MTQNSIDNKASALDVDNINITGNTISSTNTNGDITLTPNGIGAVNLDDLSVNGATLASTQTDADIILTPNGNGQIFTTNTFNGSDVYCNGLSFDTGTNTLGNYIDTTSFTPTLTFGGASTGITYTAQTGSYSRIGNMIFFNLLIELSNKGTATGNAAISLPVSTTTASNTPVSIISNITLSGGRTGVYGAIGTPSSSTMGLFQFGSGVAIAPLDDTGFSNTSIVSFSDFYYVP